MKKVRDHIPLEQGLRPYKDPDREIAGGGQRPYSIRTRIKTPSIGSSLLLEPGQRPYSIRTRIKTTELRSLLEARGASETIFH